MTAWHDTHRVRLWCDWVFLTVGLVALCIPLDLVADAAYRQDGAALYWMLLTYSYPDGSPTATVVGLAVLALTLLAYWISLRLLFRAGLPPVRSLGAVTLAALVGGCVTLTLLLTHFVAADTGSFLLLLLGCGPFTVAAVLGLCALLGVIRGPSARGSGRRGASLALLGPVALSVVATAVAVTITPLALAIGERPIGYAHLASATSAAYLYYLAREQTPSDGSSVLLYRCDTLGVWCHQIDALGAGVSNQQSAGGWLRYDPATRTLTAQEGEHVLLTYPAGDLFEGP